MVNVFVQIFSASFTDDEYRIIEFKEPIENKVMKDHVIRSAEVIDEGSCRVMCYMEPNCVSINFGPSLGGKYRCELNSATDEDHLTVLEEKSTFTFLAIENPCSSKPCLHAGVCQVGFTSKGYRCICRTGFPGTKSCPAKACSHLKKLNLTVENGTYVIDPDGDGGVPPYNVTCDMTDKNGVGVTVISHDSENRTLVNGSEGAGSYSRDIQYTEASLLQLASLANVSTHCEQFIKYECFGSKMFKGNHHHAWWVSRDSVKMTYWGGAEPGSGKCACGMTKSCAKPNQNLSCNCDANDNQWREDSGLLTDKTRLPVKQLRFGDTGHANKSDFDAQGYHTLGKFKCYGIA